ncbi:mechanosensitive ion channel protein [Lewinellaceae bacterium SD302]|nr:mechanosensitive ion channel protein [Lewinellaceae bacterium SD302]
MDTEKLTEYYELAADSIITYLPKVALAIIVLLIGIRLINKLVNLATNTMEKRGIGSDILPFLSSVVGILLKIALFFVVATTLGFDTAGLVTVIAAASFAVGLALQGSLGNFAAGILILIFKPYRRGDWIQVDDFFGRVEEVQIFNTILETPGSKTLIVPNGQVVENVVTNYSEKGKVRLELQLLMAYEESFPRIREVIMEAVRRSQYVLTEPATIVGIESYDTHNIVVAVRPFVKPDDYWEATFEVHELIKNALSTAGIKMAYSEGVELGKIGA